MGIEARMHKVPIAPTARTCSRLLRGPRAAINSIRERALAMCFKFAASHARASANPSALAFGLPKGRSDGRMGEAKRDLVSYDFGAAWSRVS
jgi:hypothetical protein